MKISTICVVSLVLFLAGCNATMPNAPTRPTAADDPSNRCIDRLGTDAQLTPIVSKVGVVTNTDSITLEMLASQERATEADKVVLQYWASARQRCAEEGAAFRRAYAPPQFQILASDGTAAQLILLSRLYSGEITYGQFNVERKQLRSEFAKRVQVAQAQEAQGNLAAQQAEAIRRAQASQELTNGLLLLQASRPPPMAIQPPPTQVTCTSRPVFNQVQTVCR